MLKLFTPPLSAAPQNGREESLRLLTISDPKGVFEYGEVPRVVVSIHTGPPSFVACRRAGHAHRGTAVRGDIDLIPRNVPSRWDLENGDAALLLSLSPSLLQEVAAASGYPSRDVEIANRFQIRDVQLERIGWALKDEMEAGFPSGHLYVDGFAIAIAAHLLSRYSNVAGRSSSIGGGMPPPALKRVLTYIEENLSRPIRLAEIAGVGGLSVSHCKVLFRQSTGSSIHQYVIRRRVERASELIRQNRLPISQIALETGFSHQSHLALHMRRTCGYSPGDLRKAVAV